MNLECDTLRLLARERGTEFDSLRACPATSKDECKLLKGQIALCLEKRGSCFRARCNTCDAEVGRLHVLLWRYRSASKHVLEHVSGEELSIEAVCVTVPGTAEDEVSHFLNGLAFSMKEYVG